MENKYTTPVLRKGKEPISVPKGSSKPKEWAKNVWYVEYTFNGKQIRVKDGLNWEKDHIKKLNKFEVLLKSITDDLNNGYNPFSPDEFYTRVAKETISLVDAIKVFQKYHERIKSKTGTIQSYSSKLNHLSDMYPNILLNELTPTHLNDFLIYKIDKGDYCNKSVSIAKRIFKTFFTTLKDEGYNIDNPADKIDKRIRSFKEVEDSNIPYSNDELKIIMEWLDTNNSFNALFSRFIYVTCIRPAELRQLQVRDIDLVNRTITIRINAKKVTKGVLKADVITFPKSFLKHLEPLELSKYPSDYYIFSNTRNVGANPLSKNTAYEDLMKCLKALDLDNQGKALYSFKHTSNVIKFKEGWTISEIMKANRHTSPDTTLKYLRKLGLNVDITEKEFQEI